MRLVLCLSALAKAHIPGHWRHVGGRVVYVQPHEDKRRAGEPEGPQDTAQLTLWGTAAEAPQPRKEPQEPSEAGKKAPEQIVTRVEEPYLSGEGDPVIAHRLQKEAEAAKIKAAVAAPHTDTGKAEVRNGFHSRKPGHEPPAAAPAPTVAAKAPPEYEASEHFRTPFRSAWETFRAKHRAAGRGGNIDSKYALAAVFRHAHGDGLISKERHDHLQSRVSGAITGKLVTGQEEALRAAEQIARGQRQRARLAHEGKITVTPGETSVTGVHHYHIEHGGHLEAFMQPGDKYRDEKGILYHVESAGQGAFGGAKGEVHMRVDRDRQPDGGFGRAPRRISDIEAIAHRVNAGEGVVYRGGKPLFETRAARPGNRE